MQVATRYGAFCDYRARSRLHNGFVKWTRAPSLPLNVMSLPYEDSARILLLHLLFCVLHHGPWGPFTCGSERCQVDTGALSLTGLLLQVHYHLFGESGSTGWWSLELSQTLLLQCLMIGVYQGQCSRSETSTFTS